MKQIARTAAQKLKARRSARLAAEADTREPNGRLSRRIQAKEARQGETERAVKETVTEARMRVLGLSVADCERPEAGSVLGRIYLDPRNKITESMYIAGIRMGEDFHRYYRLAGLGMPTPQAFDISGRARALDPDGYKPGENAVEKKTEWAPFDPHERLRRATDRMMQVEGVLGMADESGRPVTSVCKAVCIRDEPIYHGHMIEFLKRGLHALVEHYGVG